MAPTLEGVCKPRETLPPLDGGPPIPEVPDRLLRASLEGEVRHVGDDVRLAVRDLPGPPLVPPLLLHRVPAPELDERRLAAEGGQGEGEPVLRLRVAEAREEPQGPVPRVPLLERPRVVPPLRL